MNWFEKIIYSMSGLMERPTLYGWFHIMFTLIVIGTVVLVVYLNKKHKSEKMFKIIVWTSWAVIFLLEIYKQLVFSFTYNGTTGIWDYQWYAFPFQLCSTPLYVLPIIGLLKECKVRDSLMAFMSTFAFFGGLVVFIYPGDVFVKTIGINIQTMIHHGLQIVLGIYFVVYNKNKLNIKYFIKAIYSFLILLGVAMVLNLVAPTFTTETFNMFYISPYFPCTLALLNMIYPVVSYYIFLLIYVLGFILAGYLIYLVYKLILGKKCKKNEQI